MFVSLSADDRYADTRDVLVMLSLGNKEVMSTSNTLVTQRYNNFFRSRKYYLFSRKSLQEKHHCILAS